MNDESPPYRSSRLETLLDVVVDWAAAGAAVEPRRPDAVVDGTGRPGSVTPWTDLLVAVGVLEPVEDSYRLTAAGNELARALAVGEDERARERARRMLDGHPLADEVRELARGHPSPERELAPALAEATGRDVDRAGVDVSLALDLFEWAGVAATDRPSETGPAGTETPVADGSGGVPTAQHRPPAAQRQSPTATNPSVPAGTVPGHSSRQVPRRTGSAGPNAAQPTRATNTDPRSQPANRAVRRRPDGQSPPAEDRATRAGPDGRTASPQPGDEGPAQYATGRHALSVELSVDSLELDVDADADELEEIVRAVRRGLMPSEDER